MTSSWSFSYNSFVKIHGKTLLELQHDYYIQSLGIRKCAIKGVHFINKKPSYSIDKDRFTCSSCTDTYTNNSIGRALDL